MEFTMKFVVAVFVMSSIAAAQQDASTIDWRVKAREEKEADQQINRLYHEPLSYARRRDYLSGVMAITQEKIKSIAVESKNTRGEVIYFIRTLEQHQEEIKGTINNESDRIPRLGCRILIERDLKTTEELHKQQLLIEKNLDEFSKLLELNKSLVAQLYTIKNVSAAWHDRQKSIKTSKQIESPELLQGQIYPTMSIAHKS